MGRLTGKRIWITGASGGIGEKMAYLAAEEGAEVIISARRVEKLTSVKEKIMSAGGVCHIAQLDVSQLEDIDRAYEEVGLTIFWSTMLTLAYSISSKMPP